MYRIFEKMPALRQYAGDINQRMINYHNKRRQLLQDGDSLSAFANAHHYFGFHKLEDGWVYREWAPAADALYLTGDFNEWDQTSHPLKKIDPVTGVWEIVLKGDLIHQGSKVKTIVKNGKRLTEHMPIYTRRAVQDPDTYIWVCEAWDPTDPYPWTDENFKCDEKPLIYEAHVGMSSEEERIASYREFADNILPIVKKDGYNTIQLMAIMEHPYYGSFGYQVSNFFAPSSRYGLPEDLKYLINKAHGMGIRVLLDVVHSHAVKNTTDGINLFDGTTEQFFHSGAKGEHTTWGTKCFNYNKPEVLHFLLSNLKYWMDEFHFDGFRFDGVTSMLYLDHGLGSSFDNMNKYFSMNTDTEAVTYLQLANELIHEINPDAITIAEDMSGMPGMCVPIEDGGIGFDYRLAMGLPDMWIKLVKEYSDEDWSVEKIWSELCLRSDPTIAYVESHDQALVGDKTMMFRLADAAMYTDMDNACHTLVIDRAVALHKMIRLVTIAGGGNGYLNFMGNEFGHPEWIDFPREGNNNSYKYCRRQWSLAENGYLKYRALGRFDREMIRAIRENHVLDENFGTLRGVHNDDHTLSFERGDLLFVFNFHPTKSFTDYEIPVGKGVDYEVLFSTDDAEFGGNGQIPKMRYSTMIPGRQGSILRLYLPSRTAIVLRPCTDDSGTRNDYLLLATDIDGTLLNDAKEVPPQNIQAMNRALDLGKEVIFSSGRCVDECREFFVHFPKMRYALCESGACIYDIENDHIIYSKAIDPASTQTILEYIADKDVMVQLMTRGKTVLSKKDLEHIGHFQIPQYEKHMNAYGQIVESSIQYCKDDDWYAEKLCLYHTDSKQREITKEKLKSLPVVLAYSEETSLEISPLGIDKGVGLQILCDHLNLPIERTIAVGDSYNDEKILEACGLSVAVANAREEILELCDVTVTDNNSGGVCEAVETYLLA